MMFLGVNGHGLGWSDSDPCGAIPAGDPYRSPGNYCTQPSGNVIEFNANGSVDVDPFTVTPNTTSSAQQTSWWEQALQSLTTGAVKGLVPGQPIPIPQPMKMPTPWYKTPLGVVGIVLAIGGSAYALSR